MSTVTMYRITTTYEGSYFNSYWSLSPASNEAHPDTGLEYDYYTNGDPVDFILPDGIEVGICDATGLPELYDENGTHIYVIDAYNGEPMVLAPYTRKVKTLAGNEVETRGLDYVVMERA